MARYISATVKHPDGKIPGDELTLIIDDYEDVEDAVIGGGVEAADALLSHVQMPTPQAATNLLLGRKEGWQKGQPITAQSKRRAGELFTAITDENSSGAAYKAVSRTLQRWADGTRKPTMKTAEKYQQAYFAHTGRRNQALERLIRSIEGKATVADLAAGPLNIVIKGTMIPYPGSDDIRNRPVKITVKTEQRVLRIRAFDAPIDVWLEVFHLETDVVLLTVDWLYMEYNEA